MGNQPVGPQKIIIGNALMIRIMIGLAFAILYLAFVGSIKTAEIILAIVTAGFTVALFLFLRSLGFTPFVYRLRWLKVLKYIPWATVQETALLLRALFTKGFMKQTEQGSFLEFPYELKPEDPDACARRIIVVIGVNFTPNSYIVELNPQNNFALLRQLVGREISFSDKEFLCLT